MGFEITNDYEEVIDDNYVEDMGSYHEEDKDGFYEEDSDGFYEDGEELDFSDIEGSDESREEETESVKVKTAMDAYFYSMNKRKGEIDFDLMSKVSGMSKEELEQELVGKVIWLDPEKYDKDQDYYGSFSSKYKYTVSNLARKLKRAKELHDKYGLFGETIKLLKDLIPSDLTPEDIKMNFGASWIPASYVSEFLRLLFKLPVGPKVSRNDYLGKWHVSFPIEPNVELNERTYGTQRMDAKKIIPNLLNGVANKVMDEIKDQYTDKISHRLNEAETLMVQNREELILGKWDDFVHGNSDNEQALFDIYMDYYSYTICRFDGSFLELPDLNPNVVPYASQKDGIARILFTPYVLIANRVGAGKTITVLCGIHELIRMGIAKRGLVVLPKDTFEAGVSTYKELYPNDQIFAVRPQSDFIPAHREKTLEMMADEKYSVVFMTFDSFDALTLTKAKAIKMKEDEIRECHNQKHNTNDYAAHRALEIRIRKLQKQLKKYKEEFVDDECACFDKLNFDILAVDEAHNYKNISLENVCDTMVGVRRKGSKKADNMLEKVSYMHEIGGRVILATGTPMPNSMVDLYSLQRYLQPEEMKICNIYHFNTWINTFCTKTHDFEVDVDGNHFRYVTRFSKFHNLHEIMSMFSNVCEFDQTETTEFGIPDFNGFINVPVKMSNVQKEYMDQLQERIEDIRARKVDKKEDNLLKVIVDASKCAADPRNVVPTAELEDEECKVSVCAKNMADYYFKFPGKTQIAFCDISTPKEGFNMYDALKDELIKRGIPSHEIAFIHDATTDSKRSKLEQKFNAGEIRILLGSTTKLGTGTNVQERLVAVSHLDCPWRPADLTQRDGRILRQGNTNDEVFIFRYITENSMDAYRYQILENKQRFISQFFSATLDESHREESDIDGLVLDYAEAKALAIGNPLLKDRVETSNRLEQARIKQRKRNKEMYDLRDTIRNMPNKIRNATVSLYNAKSDYAFYKANKETVPQEERISFGEELLFALGNNIMNEKDRVFATYHGFDVILPKGMKADDVYVNLYRVGSTCLKVKMNDAKPLGCSRRLENALEGLAERITNLEEKIEEYEMQKELAEKNLAQGNVFDEEVEKIKEELNFIDFQLGKETA